MGLILKFYKSAQDAIKQNVTINDIIKLSVLEKIGRAKYVEEGDIDAAYDSIEDEIDNELADLIKKRGAEEL
nr:hypothetical protein [Clostridioides difficile]